MRSLWTIRSQDNPHMRAKSQLDLSLSIHLFRHSQEMPSDYCRRQETQYRNHSMLLVGYSRKHWTEQRTNSSLCLVHPLHLSQDKNRERIWWDRIPNIRGNIHLVSGHWQILVMRTCCPYRHHISLGLDGVLLLPLNQWECHQVLCQYTAVGTQVQKTHPQDLRQDHIRINHLWLGLHNLIPPTIQRSSHSHTHLTANTYSRLVCSFWLEGEEEAHLAERYPGCRRQAWISRVFRRKLIQRMNRPLELLKRRWGKYFLR